MKLTSTFLGSLQILTSFKVWLQNKVFFRSRFLRILFWCSIHTDCFERQNVVPNEVGIAIWQTDFLLEFQCGSLWTYRESPLFYIIILSCSDKNMGSKFELLNFEYLAWTLLLFPETHIINTVKSMSSPNIANIVVVMLKAFYIFSFISNPFWAKLNKLFAKTTNYLLICVKI